MRSIDLVNAIPLYEKQKIETRKLSQNQNKKPANAAQPTAAEELSESGIDFAPSADEVARRAYFSYVNQGSLPGHDVQHWLVAEAELLAERNLTRVHGFHHHASTNSQATKVSPRGYLQQLAPEMPRVVRA